MSTLNREKKEPDDWSVDYFLEHLSELNEDITRSFAFILGAGASRSSGIPTGAEIVEDLLKRLYWKKNKAKPKPNSLSEWAIPKNVEIKNFDYAKKAEFYPDVFEKLFSSNDRDRSSGFRYLEEQIIGKTPNFGYLVLACVLAKTRHNVVITTNFDNLVADAISIYTHSYPLVCGHEVIATYVSLDDRRCPLILKIHNDLLDIIGN